LGRVGLLNDKGDYFCIFESLGWMMPLFLYKGCDIPKISLLFILFLLIKKMKIIFLSDNLT